MSYQPIVASKILGAKRGTREYTVKPFFLPSITVKKENNKFTFDAKDEKQFLLDVKEQNEKLSLAFAQSKRSKHVPKKVKEIHVEQGTKEWLLERKGLVTASKPCFGIDGKPLPTFSQYVNRKVSDAMKKELVGAESIIEEDGFKSQAMQNGNDLEPRAIARYEDRTQNKVVLKGFIRVDKHMGVSHDAITSEHFSKVNVEVKNVIQAVYLDQLIDSSVERRYYAQCQMQMYALDCDLTHLVIQCQDDGRLGVEHELLIVHIERDEVFMMNMIETLKKFEVEFDSRFELLNSKIKKVAIHKSR